MTSEKQEKWIENVPMEHKEAVLRATVAFDECVRDQLYEEHGEAAWRQRYESVGERYALRFAERLTEKLTRA